jgi:hypothetical protein
MPEEHLLKLKLVGGFKIPNICFCCTSPMARKKKLSSGLEMLPGEYFHVEFFICKRCWRHTYPSFLIYVLGLIGVMAACWVVVGFLDGIKWGIILPSLSILGLVIWAASKHFKRNEARLFKKHPECSSKSIPISIKSWKKNEWVILSFANLKVFDLVKGLNAENVLTE